jgi:hypothetical protein
MITLLGQHICHPLVHPIVLAVPQGIDVQEIPIPTSTRPGWAFAVIGDQSCVKAPGAIGGFGHQAVVAIRTMAAIGFLPTSTIDFPLGDRLIRTCNR